MVNNIYKNDKIIRNYLKNTRKVIIAEGKFFLSDINVIYNNVNAINNIDIEVEWKYDCKGII